MVRLGYGLGTAAIRGVDYKLRIESEINEAKEFSALSPRASDRIERIPSKDWDQAIICFRAMFSAREGVWVEGLKKVLP